MTGWVELIGWPLQYATRAEYEGRSFLLYLRNRGRWQGWIIEGAEKVHDLAGGSVIWSDELLNGCQVQNQSQAKLVLVKIFKRGLGIRRRVNLIRPRVI